VTGVVETLAEARRLREAGRDLAALDLLVVHADRDWTLDPAGLHLAWLEEFVAVFRSLADDVAAAELCERMVALDDRLSRSTAAVLSPADHDRIARAYDLLVTFHAELERYDEAHRETTLRFLEAAKEAAFSRALPVSADDPELVRELARLEGAADQRLRAELEAAADQRLRAELDAAPGRPARGLIVRPAHDVDRERDRRIAEIRGVLAARPRTARVRAYLDARPAAIPGTDQLAYRLDRAENELTACLIRADGSTASWTTEVNPAALDALLAVLGHFPEGELDYLVERLTALLVPPPVIAALGAETLLVSPDRELLAVPWEALGLGLRFRLCRTPSLLRPSGATIEVPVRRALVVADPLGDLPAAASEGAQVAGLLRAAGIEVTELREAGRDALARALPDFPLVHYAGHTDYLAADPASSHLLLADGPLTVGDLAGVALHPDAVLYLSSCESVRSGPDTLGLGAVLAVKGAAAVIGSNWPAGDAASAAMVEPFYTGLLGGDTVAGALRSARATLAGRGEPIAAWALPAVIGQPFVRVWTPARGARLDLDPVARSVC
jgi:hypothetical protein